MRAKREYDSKDTTRSFEETFAWYRSRYIKYIWTTESTTKIPTLDEVRGKVVIIQIFGADAIYGPYWGNQDVQDEYDVPTIYDIDGKWDEVKRHLIKTNADTPPTKLYVNFLSGTSGGAYPYTMASGKVCLFGRSGGGCTHENDVVNEYALHYLLMAT